MQSIDPGIITYTWATRPDATLSSGMVIKISDVGGITLVSDGINWKSPSNGEIAIGYMRCRIGKPGSGSIADNGALTLTAGLDQIYSNGIYLYFPANAIFAGSAAGLYYTVMSSTTVGTIYNDVYNGGIPTVPTTPTPFVTTGPLAYTQTTAIITLFSMTLPAKIAGENGIIRVLQNWGCANNANTKTIRFGMGTSTYSAINLATKTSARISRELICSSAYNRQRTQVFSSTAIDSINTTADAIFTEDLSVDKTLVLTYQNITDDYMILSLAEIKVLPQ